METQAMKTLPLDQPPLLSRSSSLPPDPRRIFGVELLRRPSSSVFFSAGLSPPGAIVEAARRLHLSATSIRAPVPPPELLRRRLHPSAVSCVGSTPAPSPPPAPPPERARASANTRRLHPSSSAGTSTRASPPASDPRWRPLLRLLHAELLHAPEVWWSRIEALLYSGLVEPAAPASHRLHQSTRIRRLLAPAPLAPASLLKKTDSFYWRLLRHPAPPVRFDRTNFQDWAVHLRIHLNS